MYAEDRPFTAGHTRRMPRLTKRPFRYGRYADSYLDIAKRYATVPVKQAATASGRLTTKAAPRPRLSL
jgi:5-methyltetrahydropteroyltriglutamate--homocysteine methyltransferase